MLIMPIVNKDRILNVEISLKHFSKAKTRVNYDDVEESDIIVNYAPFSISNYNKKNIEPSNIVEFIRCNNIVSKQDYFVSTKEETNSNLYDIYQIPAPPLKVTRGLDNLYGSMILDLKNEIPNNIKGRYIDLDKLGVVDNITEEKLEKLSFISNEDLQNIHKKLEDNDLDDLIKTLNFLKLFDCKVVQKTTIDLKDFERVLRCMNATNSKASREINSYYNMAKSNKEAYSKISKLYNIVYNDSLDWIHKDKIKIKTTNENQNYRNAA